MGEVINFPGCEQSQLSVEAMPGSVAIFLRRDVELIEIRVTVAGGEELLRQLTDSISMAKYLAAL